MMAQEELGHLSLPPWHEVAGADPSLWNEDELQAAGDVFYNNLADSDNNVPVQSLAAVTVAVDRAVGALLDISVAIKFTVNTVNLPDCATADKQILTEEEFHVFFSNCRAGLVVHKQNPQLLDELRKA